MARQLWSNALYCILHDNTVLSYDHNWIQVKSNFKQRCKLAWPYLIIVRPLITDFTTVILFVGTVWTIKECQVILSDHCEMASKAGHVLTFWPEESKQSTSLCLYGYPFTPGWWEALWIHVYRQTGLLANVGTNWLPIECMIGHVSA